MEGRNQTLEWYVINVEGLKWDSNYSESVWVHVHDVPRYVDLNLYLVKVVNVVHRYDRISCLALEEDIIVYQLPVGVPR